MKIADILTNITTDGSVVSLVENNEVHGWYDTKAEFLALEGSVAQSYFPEGTLFPYSRAGLPYVNSESEQVFPPLKRFDSGIILAKNKNYSEDQSGLHRGFPRMYYKVPKGNENTYNFHFLFQDLLEESYGGEDLPPSGGYLYNLASQGVPWSVEVGGQTYNQDYFYSGFGEDSIDFNDDNFSSTADLLDFLSSYDIPFTFDEIYGNSAEAGYASASAANDNVEHFYEMLLQPNAYPNAGLIQSEINSFPQQWSIPIYSSTRNTMFNMTFSTLASLVGAIVGTIDTSLSPAGGSVNLTMPLLTTAQLNAFYETGGGADLNADGSVSTADLLEFLTAFGQEGGSVEIIGQNFDSTFLYHGGSASTVAPFFQMSNLFFEQEQDIAVINSDFQGNSLGRINLTQTDSPSYLSETIGGGLVQLSSIQPSSAVFAWRLWYYAENGFAAHSSPGISTPVSIPEKEMPVINKFVCFGEDFDNAMTAMGSGLGCVRYEEFPDDGAMALMPAIQNAYQVVSVHRDSASLNGVGAPSFGTLHGNTEVDYIGYLGSGYSLNQLITHNCRIKMRVQGYVKCKSEESPSVLVLFRIEGLPNAGSQIQYDGNDYYGGRWVFFLGGVDMSEDITYEEIGGELFKIKEFDFETDPYAITEVIPQVTGSDEAAKRAGVYESVTNEIRTAIGAMSFYDQTEEVVLTSVATTLVNSKAI